MIDKNIVKTLSTISKKMSGLNWVLLGSTSLALQKVDVKSNDIDVLVDIKDKDEVLKKLNEYKISDIEYKETDLFKGFIGKFKIDNIELEIMSNFYVKIKDKWISRDDRLKNKIFIDIQGIKLPVTPLKDQLEAYVILNREKDKDKIIKIKKALLEL